jgi:GT2 family glycosyltransferase
MFHRWHSSKNIAYESEVGGQLYQLCHVRGTLYANFAMGLRSTYEKLGYFDERFFFYGCDPDLSLKAWDAGMRVIPGIGCCIEHDEMADDRREQDSPAGRSDNEKLFAKWNLPPRNVERNDFNPFRPCTVRGLREDIAAAA